MRRNSLGDINQINVEVGDKYNIGTLNKHVFILFSSCAVLSRIEQILFFKTRVSQISIITHHTCLGVCLF